MNRRATLQAKPPFRPHRNEAAEKIQVLLALAIKDYEADRLAAAERACLQILALDVRQSDALYLLGMVGMKTGRYEMAERMIGRAIAINGRHPFYHANLGNVFQLRGRLDEARASFERAIELEPNHQDAWYNLGNTLLAQKKQDEAAEAYRRALAIRPDYPDALCNLGTVHRKQGRLDEAIDCFERALALTPNNANLCCNLGDALHGQGKFDEAIVWYLRTISLDPQHQKACNCLCNAWFDKGNLAESAVWCDHALALNPQYYDARMNQCLLQLLKGDYVNGWRNYEVRWQVYTPRAFAEPLWLGAPLKGATILLYAEQGLGDSLQFLRYVPLVQAAGGRVVLDLPPTLRRLAAGLPGLAALVNYGDPLPHFDCRCPLMSLPLALGTTIETIPARVPYLAAPEEALQKAAALSWPATGLRVGLAWTGSPTHPKNRYRSLPLDLLEKLLDVEGAHFFSLQLGQPAAELAARKTCVVDLSAATGDMADTAAQMMQMDLIISIDTSMAHLAGALGRPLWVLVSYLPDWRWLLEREDSPWYPTARLFRQPAQGDWKSVTEKLRVELQELVKKKQAAV